MTINSTGVSLSTKITAAADNSYDIGESGANRFRDLYLARHAYISGSVVIAATQKMALASDQKTYFAEETTGNIGIYCNSGGTATKVANIGPASGGGANETNFYLWDYSAATLKQVVRGAADSGGAGFRLLRVAN